MPELLNSQQPAVSIILPTYNREKFLPEAIAAIASQTFTDWELIVVDDGSTDATRELIPQLTRGFAQRVEYIYQENQGAYGARNTGLDRATGKHIAFYDSDDLWLPHHLKDCVEALEANPDVDWVYGACRIIAANAAEGQTGNSFYFADGRPRKFLRLAVEDRNGLKVIRDGQALKYAVSKGFYAGLQNSVIRHELFDSFRFETRLRNEGEDVIFVALALSHGSVLAYFNTVHVLYRIHDGNSSATPGNDDLEKRLRVCRVYVARLEELESELQFRNDEWRALRQTIGKHYFWIIGYSLLWQNGRKAEALDMFKTGVRYTPWSLACWKTLLLAYGRCAIGNFQRSDSRTEKPI